MKLRLQYGLRSILIAVTVASIWLGITVNSARRQREVVRAIESVHGAVRYDWQLGADWTTETGRSGPAAPKALRRLLGDEYFQSVVGVYFDELPEINDEAPSFERLKTIKYVSFGSTRVTDAILPRIANLPKLRFLNIADTDVTDDGMRQVARMTRLDELWLGGSYSRVGRGVSDAGLLHLKTLKRLTKLQLYGDISDKSIVTLSEMRSLSDILFFDSAVTEEGAEKLRQALPNCQVSRGQY